MTSAGIRALLAELLAAGLVPPATAKPEDLERIWLDVFERIGDDAGYEALRAWRRTAEVRFGWPQPGQVLAYAAGHAAPGMTGEAAWLLVHEAIRVHGYAHPAGDGWEWPEEIRRQMNLTVASVTWDRLCLEDNRQIASRRRAFLDAWKAFGQMDPEGPMARALAEMRPKPRLGPSRGQVVQLEDRRHWSQEPKSPPPAERPKSFPKLPARKTPEEQAAALEWGRRHARVVHEVAVEFEARPEGYDHAAFMAEARRRLALAGLLPHGDES